MKTPLLFAAVAALLAGCDARVSNTPPVVEKNTTIVNPPATEEKTVENNTTIINPPAVEKKVETKTTETTR